MGTVITSSPHHRCVYGVQPDNAYQSQDVLFHVLIIVNDKKRSDMQLGMQERSRSCLQRPQLISQVASSLDLPSSLFLLFSFEAESNISPQNN